MTFEIAPHPDWNFPLIFLVKTVGKTGLSLFHSQYWKKFHSPDGNVFQSGECKKPLFSILSVGKSSIP